MPRPPRSQSSPAARSTAADAAVPGGAGPPLPPVTRPVAVDRALALVRDAVAPLAPAAMFALRDGGDGHPPYPTLFQQLVACIISIRTYDEVSLPAARRLFARAATPDALARLPVADIDACIGDATFHEAKAAQIAELARRTRDEFGGELPADPAVLTGFKGVGPKCAHLALGVALNAPYISVDIHVHRVTNRWGYVAAPTPEGTLRQLEARLPAAHHVEINRLLVPFGKHVCTGVRPRCSTCPVVEMCRRVGVTEHR
jgi:endonuclease-3